ncbi:MAG: DUF4241 domain-containing protein [Flavobacterium sp.]|nr:DUF4241 domain-containing protein [Flavobacterium sp.]
MKNITYLLFSALLTFSCQNFSDQNRPVSTTPLDTIQQADIQLLATPEIYETAFAPGTTLQSNTKIPVGFTGITIGQIKISSGQIIVCDPLHIDEYGIPFTYQFPVGDFPVQLAVMSAGDEQSVAFARIKFSDQPVVKWEQALREKQAEVAFGGEDNPELYCVDGGVAIFLDKDAAKVIDMEMARNMDGPLFDEMYKNHRIGWRFAMYPFDKYNLAAFTTGLGDGCFKSYIGFDAAGKPCRLITDFGLLGNHK